MSSDEIPFHWPITLAFDGVSEATRNDIASVANNKMLSTRHSADVIYLMH